MRALVLTEDSGKQAHETIRGLLGCMLRLVEPGAVTHGPRRVRLEPPDGPIRRRMSGTGWKSRDQHQRVLLVRTIAAELLKGHFVFVHIDGDRPWSERDRSENRALYETRLRRSVRAMLRMMRPDSADALLGHLHLLMPFYSIEAWLYQNTAAAIRLCGRHHEGAHIARFEAWAADRTRLDEIDKPKAACCLGDTHNATLTRGYPSAAVFDAERSFHDAVLGLLHDPDLGEALTATWREPT